jgi:polysaccharide biosynthesis transport protein
VSTSQVLVILMRRAWIVALTFAMALAAATAVLYLVPGRYDAIATASIDTSGSSLISGAGPGGASSNMLMQGNMLELVMSERVGADVVRRLNMAGTAAAQQAYRQSPSFGRESIDNWMAASVVKNVVPGFAMGTNVLSIKYKGSDPNQAAAAANAFLAATIDASIAMKAASAEQTSSWFAPQIAELRKELDEARANLESYQTKSNVTAGGDTETAALSAVSQALSGSRQAVTVMQSRLASGAINLAVDPSDPDLQIVASLKDKLSTAQTAYESVKSTLGTNNPKMLAEAANIAALRKQLADATDKMRDHLKDRIAQTQDQIKALEASQADAQRALIESQARRDRLGMLQREVGFRLEQLNEREKAAAQAKLQSKLTFADISVLDKATPPISASFPKPMQVILVAIGAGLGLGLVLAFLSEMLDRRVRAPADLEFATSAPMLGVISASRRFGSSGRGTQQRLLRPA